MKIEKNKVYEMPIFFGPAPVPKNKDVNGNYVLMKPADVEAITVLFETNPEQLEPLLPEGFSLNAPVVSVAECEFANIGYFGGNTYTLLNISVPVRFNGAHETLDGDLVLAMFENHADPIIGGREQLGYAKVYADMPKFIKDGKTIKSSASSWGFKFMEMTLDTRTPADNPDTMKELAAMSQGKFNYKYIQSTPFKGTAYGCGGADASYPTFNPKAWKKPKDYPFTVKPPETEFCAGEVLFHSPSPDQMPMLWHVAQTLAKLEIKKYLGAQHSYYNDACDYSHVYRLREIERNNNK